MSFLSILKELVDGTDKAVACALMGVDGLAIEKYVNTGRGGYPPVGGNAPVGGNPPMQYDVETVGIEYGKVLDEVKNAAALLSLGSVEEVLVNTMGTDIIMRIVSPEYFIAFAVGPGGNVGKARYLLRKAAHKARKELLA